MKMRRSRQWSAARVVALGFFLLVAVVTLFPIYYLILASFRPSSEVFRSGMGLVIDPARMTLANYRFMLHGMEGIYLYWYRNSILITALYTVVALFLTSWVGYGLGMYVFRGRNLIFTLVLFLMMIPLEILMLPLYKLLITIRLINTYAGVILPFAVAPIGIFFFRQYCVSLPRDFMDAGRIDGCTEYGMFIRIMAPLMKPAYGAMTILLAMREWNNFVWPLIVLRTNRMFTLPIGLAGLMSPYGNNYDLLFSGAVAAIIPIVILFLLNQRAFISGLTAGGVKG
jgi:arabinosaccharide transport system permease protein